MKVDCTFWITGVPWSSAPIALRTVERPPSQPTRKRARTVRGVAVVERAGVQGDARLVLRETGRLDAVEDSHARAATRPPRTGSARGRSG
jgi:hypothetical protein